jgi:hypothetical protein
MNELGLRMQPSSFMMEIEAHISNTGAISATLHALTVALIGPKGTFGKLEMPKLKLQPSGTRVFIPPQKITIVNHEAFQAFVKGIQLYQLTSLTLSNPAAKVSAVFLTTTANFTKTVGLPGMDGPRIEIIKTNRRDGENGAFVNTVKISNPSPLEIYIPQGVFHFLDENDSVVAEQYGDFFITRGDSYHELPGKVLAGKPQGPVRLVGVDVTEESWMKRTIKYFEGDITLTPELAEMFA